MREKQREETRRKLYAAALEVYRRDGMQTCRVEDIAQKAEVSRAAFYFHFPTRAHVLLELIHERDLPILAMLEEQPADAPLPAVLDRIVEIMSTNWRHDARLVPEMASVALCHTAEVAEDREAQAVRAAVTERFRTAAKRGEVSTALPPEALADFFLSSCLSTMMAWSQTPDLDVEFMLKGAVHLFFHGAKGL